MALSPVGPKTGVTPESGKLAPEPTAWQKVSSAVSEIFSATKEFITSPIGIVVSCATLYALVRIYNRPTQAQIKNRAIEEAFRMAGGLYQDKDLKNPKVIEWLSAKMKEAPIGDPEKLKEAFYKRIQAYVDTKSDSPEKDILVLRNNLETICKRWMDQETERAVKVSWPHLIKKFTSIVQKSPSAPTWKFYTELRLKESAWASKVKGSLTDFTSPWSAVREMLNKELLGQLPKEIVDEFSISSPYIYLHSAFPRLTDSIKGIKA